MKVLALNCGSSSVKYQLYDWDLRKVIVKGTAERIGLEGSFMLSETDVENYRIDKPLKNHAEALLLLMELLVDYSHGVIKAVTEITAVAHRVVHGGERFAKSVLIDDEVVDVIRDLSALAPLHNPPNLEGIYASRKLMPDTIQVAIFDTAFHQTMPEEAFHYAVPREWYDKYHIRRYGFHGTSHLYVSKRAAAMLKRDASECNLITMHIGNGVSHTAIRGGISVDTSMGLTPLEGAIMGTRSGDLDPAIPLLIQNIMNLSSDKVNDILNKQSGLLGITGCFADRRDIKACADKGDRFCQLAIKMESYKLKQYVGKYLATLGRVDAIVFTAGVGENSSSIRQHTLEGLEELGIKLDNEKNLAANTKTGEKEISTPDSKIKVFVIPTNEEQVLIEDVVGVLNGTYTDHMHFPYSFLK